MEESVGRQVAGGASEDMGLSGRPGCHDAGTQGQSALLDEVRTFLEKEFCVRLPQVTGGDLPALSARQAQPSPPRLRYGQK